MYHESHIRTHNSLAHHVCAHAQCSRVSLLVDVLSHCSRQGWGGRTTALNPGAAELQHLVPGAMSEMGLAQDMHWEVCIYTHI
jgi:hypothetical protein